VSEKILKFAGISDCHGIESFTPFEEAKGEMNFLYFRAQANRQRHAVVYIVSLKEKDANKVKQILDKKDFKTALVLMKLQAVTVEFPKREVGEYKNSWSLIPNDKLDPYWSAE